MTPLLIVLGGGIGALFRYLISAKVDSYSNMQFPAGTMTVNIIGSLLMGILIGYLVRTLPHSMEFRAFMITGLLGGFTTFSAFSLDIVTMIERGQTTQAIIYVALSVFVSILALFLGMHLMRQVF